MGLKPRLHKKMKTAKVVVSFQTRSVSNWAPRLLHILNWLKRSYLFQLQYCIYLSSPYHSAWIGTSAKLKKYGIARGTIPCILSFPILHLSYLRRIFRQHDLYSHFLIRNNLHHHMLQHISLSANNADSLVTLGEMSQQYVQGGDRFESEVERSPYLPPIITCDTAKQTLQV